MMDEQLKKLIKEAVQEVVDESVVPLIKAYDPEASMTLQEAAAYTGMSESYFYKRDDIKHKIGARVVFKRKDLDALRERRGGSVQKY